jgi:hypothetical protein
MSFPNKFISFDQSILSKIGHLIIDETEFIELSELIKLKLGKFEDIGEFVLALDVLYTLGKIELDEIKGLIKYVN